MTDKYLIMVLTKNFNKWNNLFVNITPVADICKGIHDTLQILVDRNDHAVLNDLFQVGVLRWNNTEHLPDEPTMIQVFGNKYLDTVENVSFNI